MQGLKTKSLYSKDGTNVFACSGASDAGLTKGSTPVNDENIEIAFLKH